MKRNRFLSLCAAAMLSQFALAGEPSVSAPALGTIEATLDFCARVNPKAAEQYWQQAKALLQGVSDKTAAEIRKSDEYRQAYDSTAEMIAKVPEQDALRTCVESLAANK